ncbi:MAG TPA: hypothetical protein VLL76_03655 [Candidatus Omnitrophota bacterium]|nr:hypothetical protein [Candidatus Omnitrophota bacterium]
MATTTYEIVNPSDAYTIIAPDHEVAALACFLLGEGLYAFEPIDGDLPKVPLFLFGGAEEWFEKTFGRTVSDALEARESDLAACLDTVLIGKAADRKAFQKGLDLIDDPAKRIEWRDHWHEERRTSCNNIGARAYKLAEAISNALDNEGGDEEAVMAMDPAKTVYDFICDSSAE